MELGEALIARLGPGSRTEALVGTRVYWQRRPQGDPLPAVVLTQIGERRDQHLQGLDDMAVATVQASAFAIEQRAGGGGYGEARELVEAVIADLLPVAEVTDGNGAGVVFWRGSVEGPRDLGGSADEGFVHHSQADLTVRYARV